MITRIEFENFKGFRNFDIGFQRLNLLVGGNNSGKTTIFHALQFIFWCINQTVDVSDDQATFRKTQVSEVTAVPYFAIRDIFFRQQLQTGKGAVRLRLTLETDETPTLHFEVYRAFGRNLMVDGSNQSMPRSNYDALLNMRPVYIPGTVGITVQEEYLRAISQQRLISEGRQNQVLRNLVYRLQQEGAWDEFTNLVRPLFALEGMRVPFDVSSDEWLTATYVEQGCEFDLVSAGSGFLQTLNLLCFLFLNESRTALLDEPDSHMHDDLQRVVFDALNLLSEQRNLQLIVATHSPSLVDAAGLDAVLLIDRHRSEPLVAHDVDTLVPLLSDQGLSLPPNRVLETLRTRKALFVEGEEADYNTFLLAIGEAYTPRFSIRTRGISVFETGGAERKWPFDAIECFERLLGAELTYIFVSDRDFLTDSEVEERNSRASQENRSVRHLARRHRESYLLEPKIIARLLAKRWRKHRKGVVPRRLREAAIRRFVLEKAAELEDEARAAMVVAHEHILRGDAQHRSKGMEMLNKYFRESYTAPLSRKEIPYKLLDAKAVLSALRREVATSDKFSFSDSELCTEFTPNEIAADLRETLDCVLAMFATSSTASSTASMRRRRGATVSKADAGTPHSRSSAAPRAVRRKSKQRGNGVSRAEDARRSDVAGEVAPQLSLDLNLKEEKVLRFVRESRTACHLTEIADACFKDSGDNGYSWARNSVRRLVRDGLLRKVDRGTYEASNRVGTGRRRTPRPSSST